MTGEPNGRPYLSSLSIKGFRGIEKLDIPRLGRITLLAGRNGVGKTTVLEAVRVYASRGQRRVLSALLRSHEEFTSAVDEDGGRMSLTDPGALFHGRDVSPNSCIRIGPKDISDVECLEIKAVIPDGEQASILEKLYPTVPDAPLLMIQVSFANRKWTIPWFFSRYINPGSDRDIRLYHRFVEDREEPPSDMKCRALGSGLPNNHEVAELWDMVALTDEENRTVSALNLVLDGRVDRVTMIGDDQRQIGNSRRVVVKLHDYDRPVPLQSVGDGATRLFGVALFLVGSRGGFLTIDEAENGIHHSVHEAFWRMVLQAAEENDVQVFATTHSFDCVCGFARAAIKTSESEGVLVRLERRGERTRAVVYSESDLETVAEQRIEVR